MTAADCIATEDRYEAATYARWPVVFERGEGIHLFDTAGKRYVDLYGGHCVACLGHSPQHVVAAVHRQATELPFYSNLMYHPSRARAARKLVEMADGFDRVFFCNSGTEANENAIKLAFKATGKTRMVSTVGGWHGRTLASLSVTHTWKLREPVAFALPEVDFVPFGDADALERLFVERDDIAGFILEPIQSISGMVMADAAYYRRIRQICDRHGVILIFDEIQTGVGRTGTFTFGEGVGMRPDLVTLAKSLGSGFPIGAVLMPERIAGLLKNGDLGSTFAGGMMAMAACEATLDAIADQGLMHHVAVLEEEMRKALAGSGLDVLGKGALLGVALPVAAAPVVKALFAEGWITGTSDHPNVIRLMPPYITPSGVLTEFAQVLRHHV